VFLLVFVKSNIHTQQEPG